MTNYFKRVAPNLWFRSALSGAFGLILISFLLIGGCSDSNNNSQTPDALRIGDLNGDIVPAVEAEYTLQKWEEGDSDNNFLIQGSMVDQLNQPQIDAINSAYQAGFFIALVEPNLDDIQTMHDGLGLRNLIVDNGDLDLFAATREFDVSGIRYFRMHTIAASGVPAELRFHRERVERLRSWENIATTSTTQTRETGMMTNDLMQLADSISYSELFSIQSGVSTGLGIDQDFEGHFQATAQGWSVHSVANNSDFYFIQTIYELAPNTSLRTSPTQADWPCSPDLISLDMDQQLRGTDNYDTNNVVFDMLTVEDVTLIDSSPLTTEGEDTTSSTINTTISGGVSWQDREGLGASFSQSTTYSNTRSYTSPSITTTNLSLSGSGANNAAWNFDVHNANAATATFQPVEQFYWEANAATRDKLTCTISGTNEQCFQFTLKLSVEYYPVSCLFIPTETLTATQSDEWKFNFPVPPTPPPPTPTPAP